MDSKTEIGILLDQILLDAQVMRMMQIKGIKAEVDDSADQAWKRLNIAHKRLYKICTELEN
jgi:hypothetical protein